MVAYLDDYCPGDIGCQTASALAMFYARCLLKVHPSDAFGAVQNVFLSRSQRAGNGSKGRTKKLG